MNTDLKELLNALPKYRSHKIVRASKIIRMKIGAPPFPCLSKDPKAEVPLGRITLYLADSPLTEVEVPADFITRHMPMIGGYFIAYENGHLSYSHSNPFAEGDARIDGKPAIPTPTKPEKVSMNQIYRCKHLFHAVQWFKNGDHPLDYSKTHQGLDDGVLRNFPPEERKANGWEGDIVRYYRTPDVPGERVCEHCGKTMHNHGWIETADGGHIVCPGDWIITGINGDHYPCKRIAFNATYEPVLGIDLSAADFSDALMWLKEGKKVARRGWNAGGQFCWMVPEGQYPARMEAIKGYFPDDSVAYGAYFALKNAQDVVVPWVPSVGDLLATDWVIVR